MKPASRFDKALTVLQVVFVALIPVLVAHSWFQLVSFVPTAFNIIFELRGIVLKLSDLSFLALIMVTIVRCVLSAAYRQHLSQTAKRLLRWRFVQAWCGLVGLMWLSLFWSPVPYLAIYQALYTLLMLVMVLIMVALTPEYQKLWITPIIVGAALQSILAVAQMMHGGALGLRVLGEPAITSDRAFGLTFNPNTLAGFLLVAVALIPIALLLYHQVKTRIVLLVALGCIVVGVLTTRSRTGVLVLILIGGCWCFRWLWARWPGRTSILLTMALSLVGFFGVLSALGRTFEVSEIRTRLVFAYAGSWTAYQQMPLLGVGAGQVMLRVDRLISADTLPYYDLQSDGFLQPAHNAYLNVLAELGPVGLLLLLIGLFGPFGGLRTLTRFEWGISVCLLGIACVMMFEFQFWLDTHWRMILLWVIGLWCSWRLSSESIVQLPRNDLAISSKCSPSP